MSIIKMQKKLNDSIKVQKELTQSLIGITEMIRGSFKEIYTKCGNKNCKCFTGEKHLCLRISWTENAKSCTKSITREQSTWAKENTERYKKFRKTRKKLVDIDLKIKLILDELESEVVNQTWAKNKNIEPP
jgi:hypothetical protein